MAPIDLLQVRVATSLQFVKKPHSIFKGQQSEVQWTEKIWLYSCCGFHAEIGGAKDLWVWPRNLQVANIWAGFSILVFYLFIFGCIGSSLLCMSFHCSEWGLLCCGTWASHCGGFSWRAQALGDAGFSSCGTWASVVVALRHVESSRTRIGTCAPCIVSLILIHWITREILVFVFKLKILPTLRVEMNWKIKKKKQNMLMQTF